MTETSHPADWSVVRGALEGAELESARMALQMLPRSGYLGVQGRGGQCSRKYEHGERPGLDRVLRLVVGAMAGRLAAPVRSAGWGTWTPASAGIAAHAHEGDVVVALFAELPDAPAPIVFPEIAESITPGAGLILVWPAMLVHRVDAVPGGRGSRGTLVWNLWYDDGGGR